MVLGNKVPEMQMRNRQRVLIVAKPGRPHAWLSTNDGTGGTIGPVHRRILPSKKVPPMWPERRLVEARDTGPSTVTPMSASLSCQLPGSQELRLRQSFSRRESNATGLLWFALRPSFSFVSLSLFFWRVGGGRLDWILHYTFTICIQ